MDLFEQNKIIFEKVVDNRRFCIFAKRIKIDFYANTIIKKT